MRVTTMLQQRLLLCNQQTRAHLGHGFGVGRGADEARRLACPLHGALAGARLGTAVDVWVAAGSVPHGVLHGTEPACCRLYMLAVRLYRVHCTKSGRYR